MPEQTLCECGCGTPVRRRFVSGHNRRLERPGPGFRDGRRGDDYRVDPDTGCWVWLKGLTRAGYARIVTAGFGAKHHAHRLYYEALVGPIPPNMEAHHRCHNRRCVNPDHIEIVTPREHRIVHHGKSRHLGVSYNSRQRQWKARVRRNGERVDLGRFDTEADALAAIERAGGYDE